MFNRAAASELRRRLAEAWPDRGLVELRIVTFHSFALSLTDRFWRRTPLAGRPVLLSTAEQRALVRSLLAASPDPDGWDVPDSVRRSGSFGRHVADALLRTEEQMVAPAALEDSEPALAACLLRYQRILAGRARVDHAGVVAAAATLVDEPDIRQALGVEHLLVDEYQDVNPAQERLVRSLAAEARSTVVVGDPDQSIYAFRGATPDALRRASGRLHAEEVRLTTGFRCAQPVIDAARALSPSPALLGRDAAGGVAAAAFAHRSDEVQWIADHVRRLGRTSGWDGIAILGRSLRSLRGPVTSALQRAGIPFRVAGGDRGAPADPWVLRLLDLVGLAGGHGADGPEGALAILETAAVSPLVGADPLGLREVFRAARRAADPRASLLAWAEADVDAGGPLVALLGAVAAGERAAAAGADVAAVAWIVWSRLPVRERLDAVGGAAAAGDVAGGRAIGRWHETLVRFVDRNPGASSVEEYLGTLDDDEDDGWLAAPGDAAPAVSVLTVHQAKGLEFRHVVVPALEEGRFPVIARCQALGTVTIDDATAEERRLLYVAITRARETVTLTATVGTEDRAEATPSRYFTDLVDHLRNPADLLPPPPVDALHDVVTVADARRVWGRSIRDGGAGPDDRGAAAAGLRELAGGASVELPWVPCVELEPMRPLHDRPWHLSASALATYLGCGRQFLFDRVLRLSPWEPNASAAFGGAVHAAIGAWLQADEAPDVGLLEGRLAEEFARSAEPAMPLAVQRESFRRRLPVIARQVVDDVLPELGSVLAVEGDLVIDGPHGSRLVARPDLVTTSPQDDDGIEVVDWKTGAARKRDATGDVQLAVYHHVVREALGRPVRRLRLAYVWAGTWSEQPVEDDHDRACADLIDVAAGGIVQEEFGVGLDPPCRHCRAQVLCDRQPRGQDLPW